MVQVLYALNGVFHKGGTEAVVLNYFNTIDKEEFHIDFLVHGYEKDNLANEAHNYLLSQGSKIFYVTPRGEDFFKNKKDIKTVLQNNKYDIAHSHMDAAGSFFLKEAKAAGIPLRVAHSHNTNHQINKGNPVKDLIYKYILDHAIKGVRRYGNVFLACSKEAGNWLFGDSNYTVLNNAINVDKYIFNEQIRAQQRDIYKINDKFVIGHVGRFSHQKNHRFIVQVFNEICKMNLDAVLMLIGTGELEPEIKEDISKLKLSDKTIFMGSRSNVNELMQAMDVFILPSLFEGLPVVGIEAQATGLPCIISDTVSEDVKITKHVYFMPLENNPKEWADCIINTFYNAPRGNTREDIVSAGYDIKSVVMQLETMYNRIACLDELS